jgi:hypothetical protein
MKWAISLSISAEKSVEERVKSILLYMHKALRNADYMVSEIDATGKFGDQLTKRLNKYKRGARLTWDEIFTLFNEDGQVFEMELLVQETACYRIVITDGMHVDVLGDGERLPESITVPYEEMDVNLFSSPNK